MNSKYSNEETIKNIKNRFEWPLPGLSAQIKMAPVGRTEELAPRNNHKRASVMICLSLIDEQWNILFIKRTSHPKDVHKGQISFPGGKLEKNETYRIAALRELNEETGIVENRVEILGKLTPLYIPVSNFLVHPYVCVVDLENFDLVLQASEVEEIFFVPIDDFLIKENRQEKKIDLIDRQISIEVPAYVVNQKTIWGATAMMLSEFMEIYTNKLV